MKCIINNKIVDAEKIEYLGFQGGHYCIEVLYDEKLYKVVSRTKKGTYREWTIQDRLGGSHE